MLYRVLKCTTQDWCQAGTSRICCKHSQESLSPTMTFEIYVCCLTLLKTILIVLKSSRIRIVILSSITFQFSGTVGTMYVQKHKTNPPLKSIFYTKSYSWRREWAFSHFSSLHTVYFQIIPLWLSVVFFVYLFVFCLVVGGFVCLLFGGFFVAVILMEGLWGEEGGKVFISIMISLKQSDCRIYSEL